MKKTLLFAFLLLAGFTLSSCDPDDYDYRQHDDDTWSDMWTDYFTVDERDWSWNSSYNRMEYFYRWDEIDDYMFEKGDVDCSVFIQEGNEEVLHELPYVSSWYDDEREKFFTQTISFATLEDGILFYVQASDLRETTPGQDLQFKITLFWAEDDY